MEKTPEQMRRDNAQGQTPLRDTGGQEGAQKAGNSLDTRTPKEQQGFRNPGRNHRADMPQDDGGRVPPDR